MTRLAGAEHGSRVSQMIIYPRRGRVRATEHAPRDPSRVLERRHCLAAIFERGGGVLVERLRAQALAATAATSPTPPGLYQRLFPSEDDELLPKELFWHIFSFWRSTRDFVSADDDAYSDDEGPHDY